MLVVLILFVFGILILKYFEKPRELLLYLLLFIEVEMKQKNFKYLLIFLKINMLFEAYEENPRPNM